MANNNGNKVFYAPPLRFPEFSGEWEKHPLNELVERVSRKNKDEQSKLALTISAQYGLVDQETFFNKKVASADLSHYYLLKRGDFAYNKSYSTGYPWGAVKRLDLYEEGAVSTLYICFKPKSIFCSDYATHYFESTKWHKGVSDIAVEGARNHGLLNVSVSDYFNTEHFLPTYAEQCKIADFLNLIERRIATQIGLIEDLKKLKSAIRNRLYKELRQTNCHVCEIKELLNYEQPTEYIVSDTEYSSDKSLTPVLTANKAFVLGYTTEVNNVYCKGDCIIFDDFTLDVKHVTFPFKVKSSAIKILTTKDGVDLKFMYEYFLFLDLKSEEHKRHYISEVEPLVINIPSLQEQKIIAKRLSAIEKKIEVETRIKDCYAQQREYLLRQMFV